MTVAQRREREGRKEKGRQMNVCVLDDVASTSRCPLFTMCARIPPSLDLCFCFLFYFCTSLTQLRLSESEEPVCTYIF